MILKNTIANIVIAESQRQRRTDSVGGVYIPWVDALASDSSRPHQPRPRVALRILGASDLQQFKDKPDGIEDEVGKLQTVAKALPKVLESLTTANIDVSALSLNLSVATNITNQRLRLQTITTAACNPSTTPTPHLAIQLG
ncbi:hypothetical protein O988_00331 [Pseudogymnoascus sp. VKM F-3808]|nr:hypothetical protein O988_00331 [Pseudogymnoascus sp. VKM F-3808]